MFTVFQMEDTEINVILTQHLDDFLGLYYDISDMDRLMILNHCIGQGNSMDVQFATKEQANLVLK